MSAQLVQIVKSFPQRRNADRDYIEPVIQILAEGAVRNLLLQIAVGRGDKTDVEVYRLGAADPGDFFGLDGAQQLHLQIHGHVADFIEEQGTAVGHFEESLFTAGIGAGEGASFIAEQL